MTPAAYKAEDETSKNFWLDSQGNPVRSKTDEEKRKESKPGIPAFEWLAEAYAMYLKYVLCHNEWGMQFCWPKAGGIMDQDSEDLISFLTIRRKISEMTASDNKTQLKELDKWPKNLPSTSMSPGFPQSRVH